MKTNFTNVTSQSHMQFKESMHGKMKRSCRKPVQQISYYESLSLTK